MRKKKQLVLGTLSSSEKCLKTLGLNGDSNAELFDAGAVPVLFLVSYEVNWELAVMWVDDRWI